MVAIILSISFGGFCAAAEFTPSVKITLVNDSDFPIYVNVRAHFKKESQLIFDDCIYPKGKCTIDFPVNNFLDLKAWDDENYWREGKEENCIYTKKISPQEIKKNTQLTIPTKPTSLKEPQAEQGKKTTSKKLIK